MDQVSDDIQTLESTRLGPRKRRLPAIAAGALAELAGMADPGGLPVPEALVVAPGA